MHDLYLVHEDTKAIKCSFHTLVVRNEALVDRYPGGLSGFVRVHRSRCNRDLSVTCHMGEDIDDVIKDLVRHDHIPGADFVTFDAASYLIGASMTNEYGVIDLGIKWIRCTCTRDGVFVRYQKSNIEPERK